MPFSTTRAALLTVGALLALSACNGTGAVTPAASSGSSQSLSVASRAPSGDTDTTSILKLLTKNVTIGSTVDAGNGDMGPHSLAVVPRNYAKLKKGQLLVCNFSDSSGNAGKGTTIEQFNPTASSKPTTFVTSADFEGCDGAAVTTGEQTYATGFTSKKMVWIDQNGKVKKTYGSPITQALGDGDAPPLYLYSPEYVFVGDSDTGAVDNISLGGYGTGKVLEVINGFPVTKGTGWKTYGPDGFAYNSNSKSKLWDTLYIADGACNAIVAIEHASNLLVKDEVTVGKSCKTFKCKYQKTVCGTLLKAGTPLNKPEAMAILPNGNMIVANAGNNTLVELSSAGKVLDTESVDTSKTPGIFGLAAVGTKDSNTALFYTDANTNTLQELEQ